MSGGDPRYRQGSPVLLADQLIAWRGHRSGWPINDIGFMLRRYPVETRAILFGHGA